MKVLLHVGVIFVSVGFSQGAIAGIYKCTIDNKQIYTDAPCVKSEERETGRADNNPMAANSASVPALMENDPVGAALKINSKESVINTFSEYCRAVVPETAAAVDKAKAEWLQRHAPLRRKMVQILRDRFSEEYLRNLADQLRRTNNNAVYAMSGSTPAEWARTCDAAVTAFSSYELNLVDHPILVSTIMNYKTKR